MRLFKTIPLLIIPGGIYNLLALLESHSGAIIEERGIPIPLPHNVDILYSVGDFITTIAIVLLFFEIVKSTSVANLSIVEHIVSTFVFSIFMAELMLAPELTGTPTFVFLMLMSFIDVIAGFTITITAARRDFNINN